MAGKDKLSKEVEEQIQSLASDVYIQIEEKLTQLICTVTPKEPAKQISIEQNSAYLALQANYQASQHELAENSKNLSEQIHQLEQSANALKEQLADEINKKEGRELNFQVELTQNNINFTETIERLEHENILLKSTLTQEQKKLSSEQKILETALSEQETKFNQTIVNLEQALSAQKNKSHQEQTKANAQNQQSQSQIASNDKKLLEQQQEMSELNNSLAVFLAQEKILTDRLNTVEQQRINSDNKLHKAEASWKKTDEMQTNRLTEQKDQITELTKQLTTAVIDLEHTQAQYQQQKSSFLQESEQKSSQLSEQLQQSQIVEENQQKVVTDQQAQLVDLDEKIKKKIKEAQDAKQAIKQLNNEQSQIKQQQLIDKKENDSQQKEQQQVQQVSQQQINQLEIKNQELTNNLITEQEDIKLYQKEVSSLKSQVTLAQEGQENILNRFNATREKQERDNDQVRETIKYLRDENNDMITQNNIQKEAFIEKTSELEHKLTEYRLKFEYAQKQLTQNS